MKLLYIDTPLSPSFHLYVLQKGCTPLLVACEYQHKDMVEYLLSLPEVDPSASTSMDGSEEGNTGLHIAAIHDSPDIANLLIRYGCPTKAINGEVTLVIGVLVRVCVTNLLALKTTG